jgi:hypothetical protein
MDTVTITPADLRAEWSLSSADAYVAVYDLALDGTEPTADEWAAIERDERIGLYEGSTQADARRWLDSVIALRERLEDA